MAGARGDGAPVQGPANHLLDVAGLSVGHAADRRLRTGVTVVVPHERAVAGVSVTGGAPGTRETALLAPERMMDRIDAVVLTGGSAFGLAAADGAQHRLAAAGRGYPLGPERIPIVPAAVIADLFAGGEAPADRGAAFRALGEAAADAALAANDPDRLDLGTVGAGTGATTANLKGGLGSASSVIATPDGPLTVAALAVANPVGSATFAPTPHFRAAPFEIGSEFGSLGAPASFADVARAPVTKLGRLWAGANTTLAVVATDAALTKAEAARLALSAQDGIALAVWPAHTPYDGDTVFALSTARRPPPDGRAGTVALAAAASATLARAIARAVFLATPADGDPLPAWQALHGSG